MSDALNDDTLQRRALHLFDEALDQPDSLRDVWVDVQCGSDRALAAEVRALLRAAGATRGILEAAPRDSAQALHDAVTAALAGTYEVQREIGRGGMSTVFLARERKHDRDVVIKVLEPSVARLFGAERFLREVRIAATLAHPHIVPLIDSGEAGGFLYYVMPWMEGETLRERLRRGLPSLQDAMSILRDVAGALAFAHGAGIVHRDLKPENVLLTASHAYLLDFGIAKLLDETTNTATITLPGFPVGTRRYMAPEQSEAVATVDARADVYSWGLLGTELLADGGLPQRDLAQRDLAQRDLAQREAREDAQQTAAAALSDRPDLPPALVALLLECLASAPERRPASMSEVSARLGALDALQTPPGGAGPVLRRRRRGWVAGAIAIAAALMIGILSVLKVGQTIADGDRLPESLRGLAEPVAVTVLRNETGDSTLAVIGRYAGDWITDGLQSMGAATIVPWSEALLASDHATTTGAPLVATVREETRAGTVVTGTYYKLRDSLHLQARLTDARIGRVVSVLAPIVVPADRPEDGIAQLRDRVMGAVAAARDERVASVPDVTRNPPSFSAYQAFDHGFDRFLAQQYAEALAAFRTAFARDTNFTVALLLGARAAWNRDEFAVAESLAIRARAGAKNLGTYHELSLRYIEALLQGDGARARAAVQRAAAIAPNSRAGFDHATSMLNAGFARPAREQLLRMDPDRGEMRGWSSYWTQRAHAAYLLGDHAEGIDAARQMSRRFPDRRVAYVLEARALAAAGETRALDSALAVWDSLPANTYWSQGAALVVAAQELSRGGREADGRRYGERAVAWLSNRLVATPTDRGHRYWLGCALYDLGRFEEARPYFEGLATEFPLRTRYRGLAAVVAARRGDRAAAERWLGAPAARDTGEGLAFRARVAAIRGDTEQAVALLTSAADRGIEAYPWIPGTAFRDFVGVANDPRGKALLTGR